MRDGREDREKNGGAGRLHHSLPLNLTANTISVFHLRDPWGSWARPHRCSAFRRTGSLATRAWQAMQGHRGGWARPWGQGAPGGATPRVRALQAMQPAPNKQKR